MATATQANNAKYRIEKHYTDSSKTTFRFFFVRCRDKNGNSSEWKDTVSLAADNDATLLANAKAHFKANGTELPTRVKPMDAEKSLN